MASNGKRVTQRDIAAECGVDHTTVSKVLSGDQALNFSGATRELVLATAARLGYRPDRNARILRGARSRTIGLIASASIVEPSFHRRIRATHDILDAGYGLIAHELLWSRDALAWIVDNLLDARVEGVLLCPFVWPAGKAEIQRLLDAGIPVVSLGGCRFRDIPQVVADYRGAMKELTRRMAACGYRPLAHATTVPENSDRNENTSVTERLAGVLEGAKACGIPEAEVRILREECGTEMPNHFLAGRRAMQRAMDESPRPRVLLCKNDKMAMGALQFCIASGIKVPDEVAITGFDNTTMGQFLIPPLTSVAQPVESTAQKAVAILLRWIEKGTRPDGPDRILFPCRILERGSSDRSAKPPGNEPGSRGRDAAR